MSKIWIVSDTHFGHNRNFVWEERGFSSIEEHDSEIIKRWNELVAPEDTVYHLGDVMLGDNEKGINNFSKLNGNIYLAIGNHDTEGRIKLYSQLPQVKDIQMAYRIKYGKKTLILSHYPTLVGNGKDKTPVYNIHGHCHNKTHKSYQHCFEVGMDSNDCCPILLDDIMKEIYLY